MSNEIVTATRPRLLVLHALTKKSRLTTVQYAKSFGIHAAGCDVTYVNALGINLDSIKEEKFDLGIVTYELLALRTVPFWPQLEKRIEEAMSNCQRKVMFPQDDYTFSSRLDDLAIKLEVDAIYSPLTKDLIQIYPNATLKQVNFHEALTGYIEDLSLNELASFTLPISERQVDLGQRVRRLSPQYGSEASKKGLLAENFGRLAENEGFRVDVSSNEADFFLGKSWLHFLANCKFTISRKGGASIADPNGKLAAKVYNHKARNSDANDESIKRLIKEKDVRRGDFSAISPRIFEAAAMKVVQILEEDEYLDTLVPWVHFIPIKADLSNSSEVFKAMKDLKLSSEIADNAFDALIASGRFSYKNFVEEIINREIDYQVPTNESVVFLIDKDSVDNENSLSSDQLFLWMQEFTRAAYLKRIHLKARDDIADGKVSTFARDKILSALSESGMMSLSKWLESISVQHPFWESYTWAWRSVSHFKN